MNIKTLPFRDRRISVKDSLVSISFNCDFGQIGFSFNLEQFSDKLLRTVSEALDQLHREDPSVLNTLAKDAAVPIEEVKRNLSSHIIKGRKTANLTAIEKFMRGRNLALEGSLQQILDNLPTVIILMLMHVTSAAIVHNVTEVKKNQSPAISLMEHELFSQLSSQLKNAINKVW